MNCLTVAKQRHVWLKIKLNFLNGSKVECVLCPSINEVRVFPGCNRTKSNFWIIDEKKGFQIYSKHIFFKGCYTAFTLPEFKIKQLPMIISNILNKTLFYLSMFNVELTYEMDDPKAQGIQIG